MLGVRVVKCSCETTLKKAKMRKLDANAFVLKALINLAEFHRKNLAELFKQDMGKEQSIWLLTLHGRQIEYQLQ